MKAKKTKVFRNNRYCLRRDGTLGFRVEWIVRGIGHVLYSTPIMLTLQAAQERAEKYLAKRPEYIDTSKY